MDLDATTCPELSASTLARIWSSPASSVLSSNLRNGAAFDNLKASWSKGFSIGDFKSTLNCKYDYNNNRDFLNEASLCGNVLDGDDLKVGYEVSKNFKSKATEVKLTADVSGTRFNAEYDTENSLKEVSAHREVEAGGRKVDLEPAWLVQAKTARVKLMSAFGEDRVRAQVDYSTGDRSASYEVGYERDLEAGKQVSATLHPDNKELEVEYVDSKFEDGATWTATASVPLGDGANNVLDAAKLQLKRSWAW